jgi:hypothetical protein
MEPMPVCRSLDCFGTPIPETIVASVHMRAHQQVGHMDASDLIKTLQSDLRGEGRQHMVPCHRAADRAGADDQGCLDRRGHNRGKDSCA